MTKRREDLLQRFAVFGFVPGHRPDVTQKSDDELEFLVKLFESMFEEDSEEDENER